MNKVEIAMILEIMKSNGYSYGNPTGGEYGTIRYENSDGESVFCIVKASSYEAAVVLDGVNRFINEGNTEKLDAMRKIVYGL